MQKIVGGVSVCQGCPTPISTMAAPNDLVFRMTAIRPYREKWTRVWVDRVANIYFHLELQCVQNFNKDISLDDVQIMQEEFTKLTEAQLQLLEQCGLLETIINLLEAEIKVSLDSILKYSEHFAQSCSLDSAEIALSGEWDGFVFTYSCSFLWPSRTSGNCKIGHKSHTERQTFLCAVQLHGFPNSLLPCTFCHNEGTADPLAYGRFPYAFLMF